MKFTKNLSISSLLNSFIRILQFYHLINLYRNNVLYSENMRWGKREEKRDEKKVKRNRQSNYNLLYKTYTHWKSIEIKFTYKGFRLTYNTHKPRVNKE